MSLEQFKSQVKTWIEEEFTNVEEVDQPNNPGPMIKFTYGKGNLMIGFNRNKPDQCMIINIIRIDKPHRDRLSDLGVGLRKQLRHDFNYEFSSYDIPYQTKYDNEGILEHIQFSQPLYNDRITKNDFTQLVFKVFNAGFRVIAFINKELN